MDPKILGVIGPLILNQVPRTEQLALQRWAARTKFLVMELPEGYQGALDGHCLSVV